MSQGRPDQILCRTRSGRRRETFTDCYANAVIANNQLACSWKSRFQSMSFSVPRGLAPPVIGRSNGLEVQRDHVRRSDELRGAISLRGTRWLTVVVIRLR